MASSWRAIIPTVAAICLAAQLFGGRARKDAPPAPPPPAPAAAIQPASPVPASPAYASPAYASPAYASPSLAEKRALFDAPAAAPPTLPADKRRMVEEIRYVAADRLNLRDGPGAGARRIAALPRDTALKVRGTEGGWLRVAAPDGTTGWVSARYTSAAPAISARNPPPAAESPAQSSRRRSRDAVVRQIIAESLAAYPGPCPCPYSVSRSGRCGGRSAWSKPGGYEPYCFADDIPDALIESRR